MARRQLRRQRRHTACSTATTRTTSSSDCTSTCTTGVLGNNCQSVSILVSGCCTRENKRFDLVDAPIGAPYLGNLCCELCKCLATLDRLRVAHMCSRKKRGASNGARDETASDEEYRATHAKCACPQETPGVRLYKCCTAARKWEQMHRLTFLFVSGAAVLLGTGAVLVTCGIAAVRFVLTCAPGSPLPRFMALVHDLIVGNTDASQYEDDCRALLSAFATDSDQRSGGLPSMSGSAALPCGHLSASSCTRRQAWYMATGFACAWTSRCPFCRCC